MNERRRHAVNQALGVRVGKVGDLTTIAEDLADPRRGVGVSITTDCRLAAVTVLLFGLRSAGRPAGGAADASIAASLSGRPVHLLEKDVWVVWVLDALYASPLGNHLVFKGGTSLSKAYGVIHRFSEDVDLTYDIRALAPDLVRDAADALPRSKAEGRRWSTEIRRRLPDWIEAQAMPIIQARIAVDRAPIKARRDGERLFIDYEPLTTGSGYVAPTVMLEFGARSTGEPNASRLVTCDAANLLEHITFPTAKPTVMRAERTFWEKATAVHVYCAEGRLRGDRFSRHWHDLARLDDAGIAEAAIADGALADSVASHKNMFFAAKDEAKEEINYQAAVRGGIRLVPEGAARERLAQDYAAMVEDGLLLDDAESFGDLLARCEDLEGRTNAARSA